MNSGNNHRGAPLHDPQKHSEDWEEQQAPVVRFWTDDGDSWGFHQLLTPINPARPTCHEPKNCRAHCLQLDLPLMI
jgi:hypothetical protein